MTSKSFSRLATISASTKRSPATSSGGLIGDATIHLPSISCTPLDPIDPELRQRLDLETPHELLQTMVDGDLDIREGDILVVGSTEYPVRDVSDWDAGASAPAFKWLVLEDLKR